jgi:hypothetical protein
MEAEMAMMSASSEYAYSEQRHSGTGTSNPHDDWIRHMTTLTAFDHLKQAFHTRVLFCMAGYFCMYRQSAQ